MKKRRTRKWTVSGMYDFVEARTLEGSMSSGPKTGVFLQTTMRVRVGWGRVSETRWPYDTRNWPPMSPPAHQQLERIARFNRNRGYFSVRSISDAKTVLANGLPFQITVPITSAWHNPKGGIIPGTMTLRQSSITETHAVLICGYDDHQRHFKFRNSWGTNWGDAGYGYLPYSYFRLFAFESWAEELGDYGYPLGAPGATVTCTFPSVNLLGNAARSIISIDGQTRDKVGWALCTIRDGFFDIEDLFVKPTLFATQHVLALGRAIVAEQRLLRLPLRFWISHCDWKRSSYNHVVSLNAALGFGLSIKPSAQRWAAAVGM